MEYLIGGDLASLLQNFQENIGVNFEETMVRQYVAEITLSLEYLHSIGIVHRYKYLFLNFNFFTNF